MKWFFMLITKPASDSTHKSYRIQKKRFNLCEIIFVFNSKMVIVSEFKIFLIARGNNYSELKVVLRYSVL